LKSFEIKTTADLVNKEAHRIISAFGTSVEAGLRLADVEPELLNARTGLGETPLHYLAVENQLAAVKALVEIKGADVNTLNDFGGSPLSEASALGYTELVRYLLSKGAKLKITDQKESVLHAAVRSSNFELVKTILDAGASVNDVEELGETALHVAAEDDGRAEIVKLLLEAAADINAKRIFDETPLEVAINKGSQEIVRILERAR
jgi:ankyrin repeat protein